MIDTLKWSMVLGIKEVTIYSLSNDCMKRPKKEVEYFMNYTMQAVKELLREKYEI